ncbi:MAG: sigma-54-dependent Fis family transcriptional regulator [Candidatus Cloacimonetes bacterium]|nr:sigma-54-dependent Fis family transcriptional regulator [Candidatus Cloacimonadota bacterium]
MDKLKILVLDDEKRYRDTLKEYLSDFEYEVYSAELPSVAFKIADKINIDIAIIDIRMPEMDGIAVLKKLKDQFPNIEVIMITGHGDMNSVIEALRHGASDYLTKPFRLPEIQAAIRRTKRFVELQNRFNSLQNQFSLISTELKEKFGSEIIGNSPEIIKVKELICRFAKTDNSAILITGESGTGKELVARGIHLLSSRKHNYFCAVNCNAVPENLFESEFFGHIKGSFTGAKEDRIGWFEQANKSTLFIDEIGELPNHLQVKLLRVLDDKKIRRIGSNKDIPIDVRIITATNKDIELETKKGNFRNDLYHRLNTFMINIPPLRERKEDIPILLEYFVSIFSQSIGKRCLSISPEVYARLNSYPFTGNVRELKNITERALILCDSTTLLPEHFMISDINKTTQTESERRIFDLEQIEKNTIISALKATNNNKTHAAKLLNISWQLLHRKMRKFKIEIK